MPADEGLFRQKSAATLLASSMFELINASLL